jgi:hypothetical protein
MTPLCGQHDGEVVLLQSFVQLGHGIVTGIGGMCLLRGNDGIGEISPDFPLPFDFGSVQEIGELASRPFPNSRRGIRQIRVAA